MKVGGGDHVCLIDTALARLVNTNTIPPHSSHFITLIFTVNFSFLSCFGKNYFSEIALGEIKSGFYVLAAVNINLLRCGSRQRSNHFLQLTGSGPKTWLDEDCHFERFFMYNV